MNYAVGVAASVAVASQPVAPEVAAPAPGTEVATQVVAEPVAAPTVQLKRDTPLRIVVERTMLSDQVNPADRFPISLAEPLVVDGRTVLPAGITGEGEIIDAKKSGGGGAAGGIVANARYLMCGQTRIPIGKMHLIAAGRDGTSAAIATSMAVGVFALFVKGRNGQIQKGTLAEAKIIADVDLASTC